MRHAAAFCCCVSVSMDGMPLHLPNLDAMVDYRPKTPLCVYTSYGVLIGELGQ